jgi:hypothetical protein
MGRFSKKSSVVGILVQLDNQTRVENYQVEKETRSGFLNEFARNTIGNIILIDSSQVKRVLLLQYQPAKTSS